jgi:ABC-type transport system substrate-binding protein
MWKPIAGSVVLTLGVLGSAGPSFGQRALAPRGELRVVDQSPLNWASITLNVFEHLMEYDREGNLVPRLATSWRWLDDRTLEVKLRRGVKFHNGETFDAEIVKLNWTENTKYRQPHLNGSFMSFKPGSRVDIVDAHTIRFVFPEPDGGALVKIFWMHIGNRQFYQEVGWGEQHW